MANFCDPRPKLSRSDRSLSRELWRDERTLGEAVRRAARYDCQVVCCYLSPAPLPAQQALQER